MLRYDGRNQPVTCSYCTACGKSGRHASICPYKGQPVGMVQSPYAVNLPESIRPGQDLADYLATRAQPAEPVKSPVKLGFHVGTSGDPISWVEAPTPNKIRYGLPSSGAVCVIDWSSFDPKLVHREDVLALWRYRAGFPLGKCPPCPGCAAEASQNLIGCSSEPNCPITKARLTMYPHFSEASQLYGIACNDPHAKHPQPDRTKTATPVSTPKVSARAGFTGGGIGFLGSHLVLKEPSFKPPYLSYTAVDHKSYILDWTHLVPNQTTVEQFEALCLAQRAAHDAARPMLCPVCGNPTNSSRGFTLIGCLDSTGCQFKWFRAQFHTLNGPGQWCLP